MTAARAPTLTLSLLLLTTTFATLLAAPNAAADDEHELTSLFVTSFDGTAIDINVCRPAGASADHPVPVVLGSHGWGGQKSGCNAAYLNAGLGWASMTQRGNGQSGGQNNIMDPDLEGRDIIAVIDHLASLGWVLKDDGPDGDDPRLGMVGGSYGGGFQWIGAFTDQLRRGAPTRVDALAPGNTWHDLRTSLAPNGVVRTAITAGLYATGNQNNDLAPWIHAAFAKMMATGRIDVSDPVFGDFSQELHEHSAAWFVEQGQQLDIPVFLQQGSADILFNLNQAIDNFEQALTPAARAQSLFLGTQDGHGLPAQVPSGPIPYTPTSGASCAVPSLVTWFRHTLLGDALDLGQPIRLSTVDQTCIQLDDWIEPTPSAVADLDGAVIATGPRGVVTYTPVAAGPLSLAGVPSLTFTATTADTDARLFWGLAVGTSPDDARLIDGQWTPTRLEGPVLGAAVSTDLGGLVDELAQDETLYLVVSPSSDQYVGHASRSVGAVVLDDVQLGLPLVE